MKNDKRFLTPINNSSMVQKVIDRLTDGILDGELNPGDKLPVEMELAEMMQVGRNTVREAVRTLVSYGVLEIRRAEGTYVCEGFSPKMINPMLYGIILKSKDSYEELIGLRQMIEGGVMREVIREGISEEDRQQLQNSCNNFIQLLTEHEDHTAEILDADIDFHDDIARCTHNDLIIRIHEVLAVLTRKSREKTITDVVAMGQKQYLIDVHENTLRVLLEGKMDEVDDAVNFSFRYWEKIYDEEHKNK